MVQTLLTLPPVAHYWVIKGFGISSRVSAIWYIKDSVPLIEKSRASCPGGRCLSFIHQVINITGLKKLYDYVLALQMALDADRA